MAAAKRKPESTADEPRYHSKPRLEEREDGTTTRESSLSSLSPTVDSAQHTLLSLLDFSSLDTQEKIASRFSEVAQSIIHAHRLVISKDSTVTEYEVLELECYLIKPGCHEDPFTHGSDEQKRSGCW